jgi:hypothetical protein
MIPRIFCGTFEAEAYWREPDIARLPSLPDRSSSRIVEAMDEMLFAFCDPGESVLTAKQMNDAHVDYLHAAGFQFRHNHFDLSPPDDERGADGAELPPSVFQRMREGRLSNRLEAFFAGGGRLEPFAVLPGTTEVANRFRLAGRFPSQDVIRLVNTKSYSLRMRERIGVLNVGVIVDDVASMLDAASKLLQAGPFLIKDDYGVSGKGNLLIETERTLQRIARYLSEQTANGRRVRFILEPYLPKSSDFSCQFRVEAGGSVTVFCVQELINIGLAFGTACTARPEFLATLERDNYFELIEKIGQFMYQDGYCGDVCVDSMILQGGQLAPLVEINARKSMSLIKHAMDRHLKKMGRRGCLTQISAVNDRATSFSGLLELLDRENVLFTAERESGILPLTAGTMYPRSATAPLKPVRGRLYIEAVCESPEKQDDLLKLIGPVMERAGLRMTH